MEWGLLWQWETVESGNRFVILKSPDDSEFWENKTNFYILGGGVIGNVPYEKAITMDKHLDCASPTWQAPWPGTPLYRGINGFTRSCKDVLKFLKNLIRVAVKPGHMLRSVSFHHIFGPFATCDFLAVLSGPAEACCSLLRRVWEGLPRMLEEDSTGPRLQLSCWGLEVCVGLSYDLPPFRGCSTL